MKICDALIKKLTQPREVKREPKLWFVTDLVSCREKRRILLANPELEKQLQKTPSMLLGLIIHRGLAEILREAQGELAVSCETPYAKPIAEYTVAGVPDIVAIINGEPWVVEVKYSRKLDGKPYHTHELQLQLYMWLTGIPKGKLVYLTPDGFKEHDYNTMLTDDAVLQLIETDISPMYAGECRTCQLRLYCSKAKGKC